MPNNESESRETAKFIQIHANLEAASLLPLTNGRFLAMVEGWVAARDVKSLVLSGDGKAAMLNTRYYDRPDVDKLYGAAYDRAGNGFAAWTVFPAIPEHVHVVTGTGLGEVKGSGFRILEDVDDFLDNLERLVAPESIKFELLKELYETFLKPGVCALQECASGQSGIMSANPVCALIAALPENADLLETLLLSLSEDAIFREEAELIFVFYGKRLPIPEETLDNMARTLRLPLRWIRTPKSVSHAAACNLGARMATAQILAFLGSDVIPDAAGGPGAAAALLLERPECGLASCAACDIDGNLLNGFYSLEFFGRHFLPVKISLPDYLNACEEKSDKYPEAHLVATPRELFLQSNGFDENYLDFNMTLADYWAGLRTQGFSAGYLETPLLSCARQGHGSSRIRAMRDGARFLEKRRNAKCC